MTGTKPEMVILHHPRCESYQQIGHPEAPFRVRETAARLRQVSPELIWVEPPMAEEETLLLAHAPEHLAALEMGEDFDLDTPSYPGIDLRARQAAGSAVRAAQLALAGQPAFSLMRPPGHHATQTRAMGFCYLGSVALAALHTVQQGKRVGIWDIDAHHGNGTEELVQGVESILFTSIHQSPGYPGTGQVSKDNCFNYPILPRTSPEQHLEACRAALDRIQAAAPDLVLVSAGFDAYHGDPLTDLCLRREDFYTLGTWLGQSGLPVAAVLEGGYSRDLPSLVEAFLQGWRGQPGI